MGGPGNAARPPRTVLERILRERRQTAEEFSDEANTFARNNRQAGRLSPRHVQRLAAGQRANGQPLGPVRPATRRLLETMLGPTIDELLSPPTESAAPNEQSEQFGTELRALLSTARRVDRAVVHAFRRQLAEIRYLDRQLGATSVHDEVTTKIEQLEQLLTHSTTPSIRQSLAGLLVELRTLAGWQALDTGRAQHAWRNYEHARTAALESDNRALQAHAAAEQAFVLLDVHERQAAVQLLAHTRTTALGKVPALLAAWLTAAHGEALAALGDRDNSLRAFDDAARLLPNEPGETVHRISPSTTHT